MNIVMEGIDGNRKLSERMSPCHAYIVTSYSRKLLGIRVNKEVLFFDRAGVLTYLSTDVDAEQWMRENGYEIGEDVTERLTVVFFL